MASREFEAFAGEHEGGLEVGGLAGVPDDRVPLEGRDAGPPPPADGPQGALDGAVLGQEGAQPQQATGVIEQGMLEMSNTSVVTEMVELINNYRVYEAGSRAVQTQDSLLDKAVNDLGRTS